MRGEKRKEIMEKDEGRGKERNWEGWTEKRRKRKERREWQTEDRKIGGRGLMEGEVRNGDTIIF